MKAGAAGGLLNDLPQLLVLQIGAHLEKAALCPGQHGSGRIIGKAAVKVIPHHRQDAHLNIRIQEIFKAFPELAAKLGQAGDQKLLELIQDEKQLSWPLFLSS
jgi:hypothetical protein